MIVYRAIIIQTIMEIPALFTFYEDKEIRITDGYFSSASPRRGDRVKPITYFSSAQDTGVKPPVVIIDCNSFEVREFSEKVMKHLVIKGTPIWFMTYIETVEDVFDAFNKDAEFVFAPYHFVASDYELKDICDVSDSVIPTVFIHKGKAVLPGGKKGDVVKVLEKLVGLGFYKNCVLDTDRSLDAYTWSVIAEDYPSTIPFIDSANGPEGFENFISPYLL